MRRENSTTFLFILVGWTTNKQADERMNERQNERMDKQSREREKNS